MLGSFFFSKNASFAVLEWQRQERTISFIGNITCIKKKESNGESTCKYTCDSFKSRLDFDSFQLSRTRSVNKDTG